MQPTYTTLAVVLLAALGMAQDDYYDPPSHSHPRPAPARIQSGFSGSSAPKPTPTPILKQINRHNEDGSYTYGYEGADGTFKIETKLPTGEVKGKYGYLDDTGKVRIVEYGANRYGFQPAGEGITVPTPTIVDETTNKDGTLNEYADQGQYYDPAPAPAPAPLPVARPRPKVQPQFDFSAPRFAAAPQQDRSPVPVRAQIGGAAPVEIDYAPPRNYAPRPQATPVHSFSPAPRPAPRPVARPLSFQDPAPVEEDIQYAEPDPRPVARPAPRPAALRPNASFRPSAPQPSFAARPAPVPQAGRGGVLDQLARDYALPQDSAAPLHDISFGYY